MTSIDHTHVSLLTHIDSKLELFAKSLPDAFQYRDPKLLHYPLEALQIFKALHDLLHHEMKAPTPLPFLRITLEWDFDRILSTLKEGLVHCTMDNRISRISIKDYKGYILTMVMATKSKIKAQMDPILKRMHAEAHKKHGIPIAIGILPYRAWDAPVDPPHKTWLLWDNRVAKKTLLLDCEYD